jgi:hypothetical protein
LGKEIEEFQQCSNFEDSIGILQRLSSCWCNKFFKNISVDQCRIHKPGYYLITALIYPNLEAQLHISHATSMGCGKKSMNCNKA